MDENYWKSKNLFGNRHYIKYEDSKVKKMKKKSLVKGIKKDFQFVFMQLLKLSSDNVTMSKKWPFDYDYIYLYIFILYIYFFKYK